MTDEERFLRHVDKTETCWQWTGCCDKSGYGRFGFRGKIALAHRAAYVLFKGEIPHHLEIDHLCRNRGCVNPDHLEAVCHIENIDRGTSAIAAKNRYHLKKSIFSRSAWVERVRRKKEK